MKSIMIMLELQLDEKMLLQRSDEIEDKHDLMIDVNVLTVEDEDSDTDVVETVDVQLTIDHDEIEVTHCIEKLEIDDIENHGTQQVIEEMHDVHSTETEVLDDALRILIMLITDVLDDGLYGETDDMVDLQHEQLNVEIMVDELDETDDVLYMVIDEIDENLLNDITVIGDVKVYDEMFDDDNTDLCW